MLSCHIDPFLAFCKDLQIPGTEVHLYKGPNVFGGVCRDDAHLVYPWWDTENVYFLPGVKPGLSKRAADSDILMRGMFTLDFDIKKELEKMTNNADGQFPTDHDQVIHWGNKILEELLKDGVWQNFRYVVLSGNGMHVHYFGEPCLVVKEEWSAGLKDIFESIAKFTPIPPDFGCHNAGRIMRMPGSWNVKDPKNKKPVIIEGWNPGATLGNLHFVQERGRMLLERANKVKAQERAAFISAHPEGGSDTVDLINQIPIEQIVKQLFGCEVKQIKKDGGMRFADEKGVERGFFKHARYNIIVHEGTSLFPPPPSGIGYNCLSLVKAVLGLSAADAIQWFCERSTPVRDAQEREKRSWVEEHQKEVIFADYSRYRQPHA